MPFDNFDVILGMDWLTKHNVILDCSNQKFLIQSHECKIIKDKGMKSSDSTRIISSIWANKLLNQGCKVYLTYVINSNLEECKLNKIWIICEFSYVFPEELPGLPLNHEVEFATKNLKVYHSLYSTERAKRIENSIAISSGPRLYTS